MAERVFRWNIFTSTCFELQRLRAVGSGPGPVVSSSQGVPDMGYFSRDVLEHFQLVLGKKKRPGDLCVGDL